MDPLKVILVDDAPEALEQLRTMLNETELYVKISSTATNVVEAVKDIQTHQPDLLFLDIDLPDGSGFDVLEMTQQNKYEVIFTTASDAHAIRAFKFSAIDYLLKPFSSDDLKSALGKIKLKKSSSPYERLLEGMKNQPDKIAVTAHDKIELVNIGDIVHCCSKVNYTHIYLINGKRIVVTKTLKEYDQLLSGLGFLRIHQSHLINIQYIQSLLKQDDIVVMENGERIPVSTRKKSTLLSVINQFKK